MQKWHLALAPLAALTVYLLAQSIAGFSHAPAWTLATTVWVAWWWITEALPLPASSLLPFVLLPLGAVTPLNEVSSALGNPIIWLFMAAFMLAKAVELSGVHRRLALTLVHSIGNGHGKRMLFAFMLATALLSMWISNTAAVLALLPVALALADACDDAHFQRALLLGLAYSASIGGVATLVGTPPNLIFASVYEASIGSPFGFTEWFAIGLPLVVVSLPIMAWWLARKVSTNIELHIDTPGPMQSAEKRVLLVFGIVVALWITRTTPFGGWAAWTGFTYLGDASIAIAGVIAMFIIRDNRGKQLLTWTQASQIPWGILLLFAGGIALAQGFISSGLSVLIGDALSGLRGLPIWLLVFCLTISVSFLTEVTSNTATATLLMPIMAAAAVALEVPPALLMIPATIACSSAFCMPVATPPNSIVFSSERITVKEMAREGLVLNVLLAVITTAVVMLLVA
ncbi:Sodium-dependent dicarboxylate transporter SdcS [Pseudidiomarina piscicola]|uniref:Sodium-dependent dicarboxylate transporter SdcS n=1 Tax=Pseudidiomarina piscicola TaxID=2614830 RepID=A0A6S6WTS9_9GAMM|nr:SLC13 family permease [Pseudidiomarina piscicola]CAB0150181.1 Sodium-dependent dicarboxylate transporter SdcS [Pseudidiomarina piscicola]VZT39620.1 Sodium-dependent dicarboxylate transporter SdcS [Pseudomonas aeruginosa]